MTRIKIVRPEDEAEKTVQVPTGRLSTMCHPVGTLPADSASEYSGFPSPAPLRAPEGSEALPERVPAAEGKGRQQVMRTRFVAQFRFGVRQWS